MHREGHGTESDPPGLLHAPAESTFLTEWRLPCGGTMHAYGCMHHLSTLPPSVDGVA